ncbi:MAG TPA: peptidoglycan DD-metalloendopeptidase family protein [Anaerolineaceae bacterium]|nr:peptidoglycan DD-metalloendopeptidase family protein [Anaerolineaceae bacterium]
MLLGCSLPTARTATPTGEPTNSLAFTPTSSLMPQQTVTPVLIMPTYTLTPVPTRTPTQSPPLQYITQSGDTLPALSVRFGVDVELITSDAAIPAMGFINPGQILVIPNVLGQTGPRDLLLPDTEVVFSPTSLNFNLEQYVNQAGGYLSTYREYIIDRSMAGWEVIDQQARDNSINPRLLLALLEQESGWVYGQPQNPNQIDYPLGWTDLNYKGLNRQLKWIISQLSTGYYGWRSGGYSGLFFPDGSSLRMAPQLNAGSAALQYLYSRRFNYPEWESFLYSENGIATLYGQMFGDPWEMSEMVGPMFSSDIVQPELQLPFRTGRTWAYTGGPHAAWGEGTPYAAIDLAPFMETAGCGVPGEAVTAVASGLIVRTGIGSVIEDLDGDGYEQTGWVILYMHVASEYRVAQGAWVTVDEFIGRSSCEGGASTGTHLHIARKYNGEWMLADGPLPMVLGGWQVRAGFAAYKGLLEKDGKKITAAVNGDRESQITRE